MAEPNSKASEVPKTASFKKALDSCVIITPSNDSESLTSPLMGCYPRPNREVSVVNLSKPAARTAESSIGLCIVMVGLPARGKSYIVRNLCRYLTWMGYSIKSFNVGEARRKLPNFNLHNHDFFSGSNEQARLMREELAVGVLNELFKWLQADDYNIGIFDATNTTLERRRKISALCAENKVPTLFIESICDDPIVLEQNIALKLKNADYKHTPPDIARADFLARVAQYSARYVTIGKEEEDAGVSYIKVYNVGKKMTINQCSGYLPGQISMYLANCHVNHRKIYISRHGESMDNRANLLGGDSHLSGRGIAYAYVLASYLHTLNIPNLTIWTSALRRTVETARLINEFSREKYGTTYQIVQCRLLNEIDSGSCTGMTYEEIKKKMPEEYHAREKDKLRYRYPMGGESYVDAIERLKPIIVELERYQTPVFVICHQAIMRIILSYFLQTPQHKVPYLECPLHQVVDLTPWVYDCERKDINLEPQVKELVDAGQLNLNVDLPPTPLYNDTGIFQDMFQAQKNEIGRIQSNPDISSRHQSPAVPQNNGKNLAVMNPALMSNPAPVHISSPNLCAQVTYANAMFHNMDVHFELVNAPVAPSTSNNEQEPTVLGGSTS